MRQPVNLVGAAPSRGWCDPNASVFPDIVWADIYYVRFMLEKGAIETSLVGGPVEYSVLRHVFDDLGLNKLCCEVFTFNEAVIRMHESFGFKQEGTYRQHILKNGDFQDVVALAMLAEDWESNRQSVEKRLRDKGILGDTDG